MRKFLISLAAAGAALAVATPAAAQYYPQNNGYNGYGSGSYGSGYNGYGYNNYGGIRALQARINSLQHRIRMLDRRDAIRDRSADRLREEAERIENRLHRASRYGLNPYEANDIERRMANLEQRIQYASVNRYGRYDRYDRGGYGDDRRDHDGDWDHDRDHDRD